MPLGLPPQRSMLSVDVRDSTGMPLRYRPRAQRQLVASLSSWQLTSSDPAHASRFHPGTLSTALRQRMRGERASIPSARIGRACFLAPPTESLALTASCMHTRHTPLRHDACVPRTTPSSLLPENRPPSQCMWCMHAPPRKLPTPPACHRGCSSCGGRHSARHETLPRPPCGPHDSAAPHGRGWRG